MHNKKIKKCILNKNLKCLYTNADQFLNKKDDLLIAIADDQPDIMLITEVIPKNQVQPIAEVQLLIDGYDCLINFDHTKPNLGASGIRGVAIYTKVSLKVTDDIEIKIEEF